MSCRRIIIRSLTALSYSPGRPFIWKYFICPNFIINIFTNKGMDTSSSFGMVPVIVIGIFTYICNNRIIIRVIVRGLNISLDIWIVSSCRVNNYSYFIFMITPIVITICIKLVFITCTISHYTFFKCHVLILLSLNKKRKILFFLFFTKIFFCYIIYIMSS